MPLCGPLRDKLLREGVTLIYGESGVGKTTLALEIIREMCATKCLYASTERLDFLRRATQIGISMDKLVVYDIIDSNDFIDLVTHRLLPMYDVVVVDSVNSFLYEGAAAYTLTGLLASSLHVAAERYGLAVVETAQVRWDPRGGTKPAGEKALELWADRLVRLEHTKRGTRRAIIDGQVYLYVIREDGIEWLNC